VDYKKQVENNNSDKKVLIKDYKSKSGDFKL